MSNNTSGFAIKLEWEWLMRAQFGRQIRALRKAKGYKQETMAKHFGIDQARLSRMERGEFEPTVPQLYNAIDLFYDEWVMLVDELRKLGAPSTPLRRRPPPA